MNAKDAIYNNMREIVESKGHDITYKDFLSFNLDGINYSYSHGTIRNAFSKLQKEGKIELVCRSPIAFYTLAGMKYENGMTHRYRGVLNESVNAYIKIFKIYGWDIPAIHDIRLKFHITNIRTTLLSMKSDLIASVDGSSNKDIKLKSIVLEDIIIKVTVHNTDNITVMIACSENPIPFDSIGLSTLSSALTRVEERIQRELDIYYQSEYEDQDTSNSNSDNNLIKVPHHMSWIVTMWHFGQDSSLGFSGEKFDMTVKEVHELYHLYLKKRKPKIT